jgi:hypothetical protein
VRRGAAGGGDLISPDGKKSQLATQQTLGALQVALCLVAFHEDFGDLEGWEEGLRSALESLPGASGAP